MKNYTLHLGPSTVGKAKAKAKPTATAPAAAAVSTIAPTPATFPAGDAARGMNARMSNEEKGKLSILAKQAYDVMKRNGATDEAEKDFRHRISLQACGYRISEARRGHFNDIAAAFLAIAGNTKQALYRADRSSTEPRRIALKKLEEQCATLGKSLGYAAPLLWNYYKVKLEDASAKQLWAAYYALGGGKNNRKGATKRRKTWARRRQALDIDAHPVATGADGEEGDPF